MTATPTMVEFGSVPVGGMANGSSTLTTDAGTINATITLTAGCDFTTSTPAVTITTAGVAASFKLVPTAAGSRSCIATVTDSSDGSTAATITLHGTGTGTAMITVTPGPLDFMNVGVGELSGKLHVTATNNGTDVLQISAANIVPTASNYVITGSTGAQNIAVGGKADWDIQCKPGAAGSVNDVFRITSNATGSPTDTVLKCNGQQGVLSVSTTAIDFGSVALNGMATMNVTLSNTGNVAVTGIGYTLDNANVGYAVVDGTVPATLAAGDSKTVTIKLAPITRTDGATSHVAFKGTWTVGSVHNLTAPAITLTGKTIALIVSTQTLTFGDFRYDAMPRLSFTLKNDGTGDALISSITLTPDTGTQGSELPVGVTLNGSAANLATPLHAGEQYLVTTTAKPENRTGAIGGKIVVASAGISLAPVTITGNATAAMFATTDASFGAVDVQGAAQMLTVTIKNSDKATANLDVSAVTIKSRSGTDAAFTFTLPGARSIAPNTEIDIPVMYLPTVARPAGDADTVVLQATLTGALNGPTTMAITLTGRGIDRHLVLPATAPAFPATFRNPGDTAPVVPVTIQNAGEAPMTVTGVMLSGDPVWQLVDPDPVTIPGGGSHDFMVQFAPNDIGPAPRGQVSFTTNDTAARMAAIPLDGMGLGRAVQFGPTTAVEPRTIYLGITGANGELTVDDALVLTSMDPSNSFRVHRIELEAGPFKLDDAPYNDALLPMEVKRYAVTLAAPLPGHFEAMAILYLDQDPVPQSQVVLVGDAVAISVGGGGGCSAGAGGGGGAAVIVLLGMLATRRRRGAAVAVAMAACAIEPGRARADGVSAGAFDATPATSGAGVVVQTADVGQDGAWVVTSVASYATDLVLAHVLNIASDLAQQQSPLSSAGLLDVGGAYAFFGRFEAGLSVPVFLLRDRVGDASDRMTVAVPGAHETALGDVALHGKAHLVAAGPLSVGAALRVTLPTAGGPFVGSDLPTARVLALATLAPGERWAISANVGGILRKTADYRETIFVEQGSGLAWGAGGSVRLVRGLFATGELFGEVVPASSKMMGSVSPIEGLAGLSYRSVSGVAVGVAAGAGLNAAFGSPGFRGTLSLSFTAGMAERRVREVVEQPVAVLDRDGDGIADAQDRCPDQAEDKDGFEDDDGCPELDNDGDGIADAQDRCPDQAETFNGIDDADGCPEVATVDIDPAMPARQVAEVMFMRGRERLAAKDYLAACAAFEQSFRADPAAGTRYNLATCDAEIGKLATASALFAELARVDKKADRRAISAERVTELAARMPRLALVVRGAVPGVQVTLNGADATALIGTPAPVDLGIYAIEATAPGRRAWHGKALVRHEAEVVTVEIRFAE